MVDLGICRVNDLDDIFYATKDSQGFSNAMLAIRYVLFDDESVFEGREHSGDKYLYISSTNNARKKAMLLQQDDLAHILIKYCMASFGLRGKDFSITEEEFLLDQKRIDRLEISPYEMIEAVSYAAMGDIYNAYVFLFSNKDLLNSVVEYMLEERYISGFAESIDNFGGIIDNNQMDNEVRYRFYDAYVRVDEDFAELKRNNSDYIK